MNIQEQIAVMLHFADGGEVEYLSTSGEWERTVDPIWNWNDLEYRVKAKPLEILVNVFSSGTIVYCNDEEMASEYEGRTVLMREVTE